MSDAANDNYAYRFDGDPVQVASLMGKTSARDLLRKHYEDYGKGRPKVHSHVMSLIFKVIRDRAPSDVEQYIFDDLKADHLRDFSRGKGMNALACTTLHIFMMIVYAPYRAAWEKFNMPEAG